MDKNLKDSDILLVREKGKNNLIKASMDMDGKVKTSKLNDVNNPDFLNFDRNSNMLENFFSNFARQVKNPTEFEFFRVPVQTIEDVLQKLQKAFRNPNKPENKEFIEQHKVNPEDFLKKQVQFQQSPPSQESPLSPSSPANTAIAESRLDWSQFERIGITRESLEKTGNLDKLLNWQKTDLMPISLKFDEITLRTDARLSLRETADGKLSPSIHALRKEPELERPYFGVRFSPEDKENLLKTGNLGRIAEAEYTQGVKTPVFISIDKQTNELVAYRAERVKIPDNIKGLQLSDRQKKELSEGKAVYLENMLSKKNTPFSAFLQFNADKRGFEFRFDNDKKQEQTQKQVIEQKEIPKTFRNKKLTEDPRSSLGENKTVYTGDLMDGKGKKYSGYITLNKESGKLDFMFPKDYKEALAAGKVIPDDRHKTQIAVNTDGKTHEATKKVDEPLKQGQTNPTEKQAEKQQKTEEKKEKKSKGKKVPIVPNVPIVPLLKKTMKTILSEKPSVAREIAAIVGANNKEDGFLYGNGYTVTWALGHLVTLAMPEDYGFAGYNREHLPMIPNPNSLNHDLLD